MSAISVQLSGSHTDEAYGFPIPQAAIALSGRADDFEMAPWKLVPTAYLLLAEHARAEGDEDRARAFMDAANTTITEHCEVEAGRAREHFVAECARHWSEGPFSLAPIVPHEAPQQRRPAARTRSSARSPAPAPAPGACPSIRSSSTTGRLTVFATASIRIFIVCALLALLGFGIAAFTASAPAGVLLGTIASFAAACVVIVEVEDDDQAQPAEPWTATR